MSEGRWDCYRVRIPRFENMQEHEWDSAVIPVRELMLEHPNNRLITHIKPSNLSMVREQRENRKNRVDSEWKRVIYESEINLISNQVRKSPPLDIKHYILFPDTDNVYPSDFPTSYRVSEEVPEFPFTGEYTEHPSGYLFPMQSSGENRRRPMMKIIALHSFKGTWKLNKPFGQIIRQADGELFVSCAFDRVSEFAKEKRLNELEAELISGSTQKVSTTNSRNELQRLYFDAENSLQLDGLKVVRSAVFIALVGGTEEDLENRVRKLKSDVISSAAFNDLNGYQLAAFRAAFSPNSINWRTLPNALRYTATTSTQVVACGMWGWNLVPKFKGVYFGSRLSIHSRRGDQGPFYHFAWEDAKGSKLPAHLAVWGMTGAGKTVSVSQGLLGEMAMGTQVAVLDPQGNFTRLANAVGYDQTSYLRVGEKGDSINIFDVVHQEQSDQIDHVSTCLELLRLPRQDVSRPFNEEEEVAVTQALRSVYNGIGWEYLSQNRQYTPTMGVFVERLNQVSHEENISAGIDLARYYRKIYCEGDNATLFNKQSTLDINMTRPLTVLDFEKLFRNTKGSLQSLWYYIVASAVYREIRLNPQLRQIMCIDEFGTMGKNPALVEQVEVMTRTMRTFRGAVWLLDQTPHTLSGIRGGQGQMLSAGGNTQERKTILEQIPTMFVFKLKKDGYSAIKEQYPGIFTDSHIKYLAQNPLGKGYCVFVNENTGAQPLRVDLTSRGQLLLGS